MDHIVLLFLFAILIAFVIIYCLWQSTYWRRHGVRGPNGFPLIGNMWQFIIARKHYGDVYEDIYNAYPELPFIGIYRIFNEPAILVRSQELLKDVMIRNFQHFQDNVLWIDPKRDAIIWHNPFVTKGEKWKQMRAEIVPIFTPNKVKLTFPHIESICRKLVSYVDENIQSNCFEAKDLFSKYTLDVVASAAYGLDGESFTNSNSDFTQLVEHLFLPNLFSFIDTIALLFSPGLGNLIKYCYVPPSVQKWLRTIIGSILEKRLHGDGITSVPKSSATTCDFLQWLIEAKQKANEPIDVPTIVGHCSTFLLEGFETSSSLMSFALFEYAINPLVQQRVLEEIDAVLARFNGRICYEALQEMTYFEASLYETLRLYPPMLALMKHCTKSIVLPSQTACGKPFKVPEGMIFVVPVKAIHFNSDFYPEPYAFKPERFMEQNDKQHCTFLGFGEGPRMCPGMRFGLAQSKAGLVALLSKYSVHLSAKTKLPLQMASTTFLTAAQNGIWISFKRRTNI